MKSRKQNTRTKLSGKIWFRGLTPEQQEERIAALCQKKAELRIQRDLELMAKYGQRFACFKCLHRKTGSCLQEMPCGCSDFYDQEQNLSFKEIIRNKKLFS
jgi:hypothetical protein